MNPTRKKILFYAALGLVALLLVAGLLGAGEAYCRIKKTCTLEFQHYQSGQGCRQKCWWRWCTSVSCHRHRRALFQGRQVYDMKVAEEGERRFTPDGGGPEKKYAALFFGCSYTYGDGVDDDQTVANQFARAFGDAQTKNLAVGGGGPTNALEIIRSSSFLDMPERGPRTIGLYGLIGAHVMRVSGRGGSGCGWMGRGPKFRYGEGGKLVRDGLFSDSCPVPAALSKFLLQNSQAYLALSSRLYALPIPEDFQLTADLLIAARDSFRERFHSDNFFVFRYPDPSPQEWGDEIIRRLRAADVKVLDYIDLVDFKDPRYRIPGDVHPTALLQEKFGQALARDLRKYLKD